MARSKINFTMGEIHFHGEGEEAWVAQQLDKVLDKAGLWIEQQLLSPDQFESSGHVITGIHHQEPSEAQHGAAETAAENKIMNVNLAQFLSDKQALDNQVRKFLATAQWLHMRGNRLPTTQDVTKALQDHRQKPLGNPSDSLNKNVRKEFCKKDGKQFFVTAQGRKSLL